MKITETMLISNFSEITPVGDIISKINGELIYWQYRVERDGYRIVCDPSRADIITLAYDRSGEIQLDDPRPDISAIEHAIAEEYGAEIKS